MGTLARNGLKTGNESWEKQVSFAALTLTCYAKLGKGFFVQSLCKILVTMV